MRRAISCGASCRRTRDARRLRNATFGHWLIVSVSDFVSIVDQILPYGATLTLYSGGVESAFLSMAATGTDAPFTSPSRSRTRHGGRRKSLTIVVGMRGARRNSKIAGGRSFACGSTRFRARLRTPPRLGLPRLFDGKSTSEHTNTRVKINSVVECSQAACGCQGASLLH